MGCPHWSNHENLTPQQHYLLPTTMDCGSWDSPSSHGIQCASESQVFNRTWTLHTNQRSWFYNWNMSRDEQFGTSELWSKFMMPNMAIYVSIMKLGPFIAGSVCWQPGNVHHKKEQMTVLFLTSLMNIRHVVLMFRRLSYWQRVLPLASEINNFQRITDWEGLCACVCL